MTIYFNDNQNSFTSYNILQILIMNWIKGNIDKSMKELNAVIGIDGVLILKPIRKKIFNCVCLQTVIYWKYKYGVI